MHKDFEGRRFSKLTVIDFAFIKDYKVYWNCKCDCGNSKVIREENFMSGRIKGCGCAKIKIEAKEGKLKNAMAVFRKYSDGDLDFDQFLYLSQLPCHYCGTPADLSNKHNIFSYRILNSDAKINGAYLYNGLDRVDNNLPHNKDNVVPCCIICNRCKSNKSSVQFLEHIKNLKKEPNIIYANNLNQFLNKLIEVGSIDIKLLFPYGQKVYHSSNKAEIVNNYMLKKICELKTNASRRGLDIELTQIQMFELFLNNCGYCDAKTDPNIGILNGIDRVNNNIGYLLDNSISCCKTCNFAKEALDFEKFVQWIHRIKSNHFL